jgi:hypothetical protein
MVSPVISQYRLAYAQAPSNCWANTRVRGMARRLDFVGPLVGVHATLTITSVWSSDGGELPPLNLRASRHMPSARSRVDSCLWERM